MMNSHEGRRCRQTIDPAERRWIPQQPVLFHAGSNCSLVVGHTFSEGCRWRPSPPLTVHDCSRASPRGEGGRRPDEGST